MVRNRKTREETVWFRHSARWLLQVVFRNFSENQCGDHFYPLGSTRRSIFSLSLQPPQRCRIQAGPHPYQATFSIFCNIFYWFMLLSVLFHLLFDNLGKQCFHIFHAGLWLVVWSVRRLLRQPAIHLLSVSVQTKRKSFFSLV